VEEARSRKNKWLDGGRGFYWGRVRALKRKRGTGKNTKKQRAIRAGRTQNGWGKQGLVVPLMIGNRRSAASDVPSREKGAPLRIGRKRGEDPREEKPARRASSLLREIKYSPKKRDG